jgi:hypothetical protein
MGRRRKSKNTAIVEVLGGGFLLCIALAVSLPRTGLGKIWAAGFVIALAGAVLFGTALVLRRKQRTSDSLLPSDSPASRQEPYVSQNEWSPLWGRGSESDDKIWPAWKEAQKAQVSVAITSQWSLDLLHALEWKRFELVTAAYFEALGFKAKTTRAGADGGVDVHLHWQDSPTASIIVQCKAWKAFKVGIKPIRELLGVMTLAGVSEGIFITTGMYTKEAKSFAAPAGTTVHLIDGNDFLAKIAALKAEQQASLLNLATSGDYTTPTCASCGVKLVLRENPKKGDSFWGCVNFPRCRTTMRAS